MGVKGRVADLFSRRLAGPGCRAPVSIEVYPPGPKDKRTMRDLFRTVATGRTYGAEFVSVTCGAMGGNRDDTAYIAGQIQDEYGMTAVPHLVCKALSKYDVNQTLEKLQNADIRNLMILRGDPEKKGFTRDNYDFIHASDLFDYMNESGWGRKFCRGCAGYPEVHPEAASADDDMKWLKYKVDNGAEFVVTQLFFDNKDFYDFVGRANRAGIHAHIIPGMIVPGGSKQLKIFRDMCGARVPSELKDLIEDTPKEDRSKVLTEWTAERIDDLIESGVPGIHIYTMDDWEQLDVLLSSIRR